MPLIFCLGFFSTLILHAQSDPPDPQGVFAFAPTSNDGGSGAKLADQFILDVSEHARYPGGVFEPRFAEFSLSNTGPGSCAITEVYIYDPNHLIVYSSRFGNAGAFSDLYPIPVPADILAAFAPTDSYAAVPGVSEGITPGTFWGLYRDYGYGLVEALDNGSVKIGLLVEESNGNTRTFVNVPENGSTAVLFGLALIGLCAVQCKLTTARASKQTASESTNHFGPVLWDAPARVPNKQRTERTVHRPERG